MLKAAIVNGDGITEKANALRVVASMGSVIRGGQALIEDVLTTLLLHESPQLRIAALDALASLESTDADAVARASRLLHASVPALREAACQFVFAAVATTLEAGESNS